jgi:hypothetical protein
MSLMITSEPTAIQRHIGRRPRECAYARNPSIGQLDKALDEANARGWTVVDMKNDWQRVFPFEQNVSRAVWKETRVASR